MRIARRAGVALVVLAVVAIAVVGLVRAAEPARHQSLRERVDAVAATVKCPTCGGLSVKDSTSVLAAGARSQIQQQLTEGRTPDQIRQYFVDRYGQQALLDPGAAGPGLLVWLLPGLGVLAAALLAWRWTRRRRSALPDGADDAATALAAYRAGRLAPDTSPAGDALSAALAARIAAEEDDDADGPVLGRADARLGAAYRRYEARKLATPARAGREPGRPRWQIPLPRRALTAGAVGAVLVAALAGVLLTGHHGSGTPVAAASSAPATGGSASMPSPPPGYTGGMPQTAEQWVSLGKAYDKNHQYRQAVAAYDMALKLQPGADAVTLMRADVLVRSGQAAQALPDMQRLGAKYPDNPDVLLILGLAQHGTGSPDAAATLRRFLQLAPNSPAAPGVRSLLAKQ